MHGARAHFNLNARHVVAADIVLIDEMECRLKGALLEGVAGEVLAVNEVEAEFFAQPLGYFSDDIISLAGDGAAKAETHVGIFQDVRPGGDAFSGQQGGDDAIPAGKSGLNEVGHGGVVPQRARRL